MPNWRPLVTSFPEGGQGPAVQTSSPMVGRFHRGADHLLRMQQVFLQRRYRFRSPLPEKLQELTVLPQLVFQIIIRPVRD